MDMDAALWSGLPFEMVERVLSFLPVPDLCRHRSVCKKWDRLICSPKFGAAHAHNAAKRDASYLVMNSINEGWCFLDLDARRWYTVKETDDRPIYNPKHLLLDLGAMDGGLTCKYIFKTCSIIVYNPIAIDTIEFPAAPGQLNFRDHPMLTLVVDSTSQQFRIFCINQGMRSSIQGLNDRFMLVYDSATNEWKSTSTYPFFGDVSVRGGVSHCNVMFQGLLYAILSFVKQSREPAEIFCLSYELWRYNTLEDTWERMNVDIASRLNSSRRAFCDCQPPVSDGMVQ